VLRNGTLCYKRKENRTTEKKFICIADIFLNFWLLGNQLSFSSEQKQK
jgi:hypothetical protein